MMLRAPAMLAVLASCAGAGPVAAAGGPWQAMTAASLSLLALLAFERLAAGVRAAVRFRDPAGLGFLPVHLVRDAAWAWALTVWVARRLRGRPSRPADSM
jgi:hypothetical protein